MECVGGRHEWVPDLGGFFGLLIGVVTVCHAFRATPINLGVIGWLILGAIGGAIGGFMMGSLCNAITLRSISKRRGKKRRH